jgi:hypothetical protein
MNCIPEIEQVLRNESVFRELEEIHAKDSPACTRFVSTGISAIYRNGILSFHLDTLCSRDVAGVCKDPNSAKALKDQGAAFFKESKYLEAATEYSKSLREAPQDSEEDKMLASIVHSNRALCLLRLPALSGNSLAPSNKKRLGRGAWMSG